MKDKLKSKKFIIICICIAVVFLAALGSGLYLLVFRKQPAPTSYWDEKEGVSSITEIVGEREWEMEEGEKSVKYIYSNVSDSKKDIEKYLAYLKEDKGFQDIQIPEAVEEDDEADENTSVDKNHYELGSDSVKEGKLLKITINVKKNSYTIRTQKKKGTLEESLQAVDEAEYKLDNAYSFEDALEKIYEMGPEKLGIEISPEGMSYIPYIARIVIDDKEYYNIRVYKNAQAGTLNYEGSYLLDCRTLKHVYKYEEFTQECVKIE